VMVTPSRLGNRRYSRFGNLRHAASSDDMQFLNSLDKFSEN
jgi:hypothetical protein